MGQEKKNRVKETDRLTEGARETHREKVMSKRDTAMQEEYSCYESKGGREDPIKPWL